MREAVKPAALDAIERIIFDLAHARADQPMDEMVVGEALARMKLLTIQLREFFDAHEEAESNAPDGGGTVDLSRAWKSHDALMEALRVDPMEVL